MSPRRAMYNVQTSMMRRPSEDDDRQRQYQPPSPIHGHPYSPSSRSQPQSPPTRYPSRPSTAINLPPYMSPKLAPPPSPKVNGSQGLPAYNANGPSTTTRYDPLADHRETNGTRRQSHAQAVSPIPTRGTLPPYNSYHPDSKPSPTTYPSPTQTRFPLQSPTYASSHAHPNSRHPSISYSPAKPPQMSPKLRSSVVQNGETNGMVDHPSSQGTVDEETYYNKQEPVEHPKSVPARKSDPMSFSNILSNDVSDTPKSSSRASGNAKAPKTTPNLPNGNAKAPLARKAQAKSGSSSTPNNSDPSTSLKSEIAIATPKTSAMAKRKSIPSIREAEKVQRAMEDIDAMDLSDVEEDTPEFMPAKLAYLETSKKRLLELERTEGEKHKRRRNVIARSISRSAGAAVEAGKQQFRYQYEPLASQQVQAKEVQDEKERKKDMQRKRRREKTLQTQAQLQQEAHEKAMRTTDEAERIKLVREAQKAEKKVKTTKRMIERADAPEGIREVTPLAPNLEGGTMGTFQTSSNMSPEPPRKKARTGGGGGGGGGGSRPKKSKEKKEAEKAAAEAGYAAGLHTLPSNEPVLIAPKEDTPFTVPARPVRETRRSKETAAKDASPAAHIVPDFDSEVYTQIYAQIWKEISKNVNKVVGIKNKSHEAKATNFKKTAVLASKEARRWQSRTNKATKDVQARAKRSMRDMTTFWKRNERAEREMRKQAEKQELENAKKAEADRESNRQKRKLNFLIEQTELFSHFVGRKVKTAEVERSTDSEEVAVSTDKIQSGEAGALTVTLPDSTTKAAPKVTNFEDLDFDAEDDTVLRAAAEANAQNAVEEAQAKARAFNTDGQELQGQFDDGEMNFQNPTGLGDIDVSQPKMLAAQLKEYQLKGLNWLVHLYEQGINGILADEMGLGKTVQSISVMGYLAEKYNIWGPFIVIAPSSTLHNWQQEIARFVPDLKCLPYWGNAKDRKVLRKFWDRKHITYNKDSPFHVLITSYQLAVTDSQYIQKIRWQYMILDEAQAIKSSQSTRWKSLLGLRCRNRLLLTGTPIQNNMQELWALLHFIMPTLFDSHEEFSEWFSKDIESHAQSNTKLNEDQLKRLHKILKPFMLRRVKKHVQKELGDKEEKDVYCDLSYRQRVQYATERSRINILDVAQIAAIGDDQDSATLMTLVMEFRKICNHPDLLKRAETTSPLSNVHWGECESFVKEGNFVNLRYSTRNLITYDLPRLLCNLDPRIDLSGSSDTRGGSQRYYLRELLDIWTPERIMQHREGNAAFSWLPFADMTAGEAYRASHRGLAERAIDLIRNNSDLSKLNVMYDESSDDQYTPTRSLFKVTERNDRKALAELTQGPLHSMFNISRDYLSTTLFRSMDRCAGPGAQAPPIEISSNSQAPQVDFEDVAFNMPLRQALSSITETEEAALINADVPPNAFPVRNMLPEPLSRKSKYTNIKVPSMQRFVTDSGKLARLDQLLRELKQGGHRVLLYFQMTRMMDLMEEYLTFRNYRYLRLDGSTKLEDRRDAVADFQTQPEVFIFLLSTRAGGLGINLTAADTVIFYDSDWNPTIDSQAMDRAHRLGQTKQVTVYRMITRGTIEERIRKRALQKEEVQRVVISGGGAAGVDFNARSKENRTKDIALWLADDEQAELIEKKEAEVAAKGEDKKQKKKKASGKKKEIALEDMYHEGEGDFGGEIDKPSGAATPIDAAEPAPASKRKGISKKAKTAKQRLAIADGSGI